MLYFYFETYIICIVVGVIAADIYLHNPRGSNNRLSENTRPRKNANRLFDSQNNRRGGYNAGGITFYSGSILPIEWTSQHSCSSPKSHCEIIIQYMCHPDIRDGVSTSIIPDNPTLCSNNNCDKDRLFGMHENFAHYKKCKTRRRNFGLFTADQRLFNRKRRKLGGNTAIFTRQNRAATRYAYECAEERDYYPYWHSSPWKDVAVLTNDATRCPFYQTSSQNTADRWECTLSDETLDLLYAKQIVVPNNKSDCENFKYNGEQGNWQRVPSHKIPPPDCREAQFSRDNHLGNGASGYPLVYNWTVPSTGDSSVSSCVLRLRYNISTADFEPWSTDSALNKPKGKPHSLVDLSGRYSFKNRKEAESRGYAFKNAPTVQVFGSVPTFQLAMQINTAQYGRTFQDRSHMFEIKPKPQELKGATIHNLNVRGKRGNIVQVYPAVEYDFVPNTLLLAEADYVHFQWTGSNTNPANNDGQGKAGSDRNNVLIQRSRITSNYSSNSGSDNQLLSYWKRSYPGNLSSSFLDLSKSDLVSLAFSGAKGGSLDELNDAAVYYDLGPKKVVQSGTYHYMCTRNNNFSNRSQKGRLICLNPDLVPRTFYIGWNGGTASLEDGKAILKVKRAAFTSLQSLQIRLMSVDMASQVMDTYTPPVGDSYAGRILSLQPYEKLTSIENGIEISLRLTSKTSDIEVYQSTSADANSWLKVKSAVDGDVVRFSPQRGGIFVARNVSSSVAVWLLVVALLVIVILVVFTVIYFRTHPDKWVRVKRNFGETQRNFKRTL